MAAPGRAPCKHPDAQPPENDPHRALRLPPTSRQRPRSNLCSEGRDTTEIQLLLWPGTVAAESAAIELLPSTVATEDAATSRVVVVVPFAIAAAAASASASSRSPSGLPDTQQMPPRILLTKRVLARRGTIALRAPGARRGSLEALEEHNETDCKEVRGAGTRGLKPNASVWSTLLCPWDFKSVPEGLHAAKPDLPKALV